MDDGVVMEPQVSVPRANPTMPPETATPDPLEEPPLHRPGSQGFFPAPVSEAAAYRYPIPPASSTMASFPRSMAPASSSF